MIVLKNVSKRYITSHGPSEWVISDATFTIPEKANVGLIGQNGAGKSTLLRLIAGADTPTKGIVERHCRVSWPLGLVGGLQGSLTGRQNAKFVCRIHGERAQESALIESIKDFSEIGKAFDEPVKTYSSGMHARLKFAISMVFKFDVYISDELTAVGDINFRQKARNAFKDLVDKAGLIMVSHQEGILREFCNSGVYIRNGFPQWYDDLDDALVAYSQDQKKRSIVKNEKSFQLVKNENTVGFPPEVFVNLKKRFKNAAKQQPVFTKTPQLERFVRVAEYAGLQLMSLSQCKKNGYRLKNNISPVLLVQNNEEPYQIESYYDVLTQCEKIGHA